MTIIPTMTPNPNNSSRIGYRRAAFLLVGMCWCSAARSEEDNASKPADSPAALIKEKKAEEEKANPHHRLDEAYGAVGAGAFINLKGEVSPMVSARAVWVLGEEFGYGYEYSTLLNPRNPLKRESDPLKSDAKYHYSQWGFIFEHIIDARDKWHPVYGIFAGFGVGGVVNSKINKLASEQHERYDGEFSDKHMAVFEPRFAIEYNANNWLRLDYGAAGRIVYGGRSGTAVNTRDASGFYGFVTAKFGNVGSNRLAAEEKAKDDAKDKVKPGL